MKTPKKKLRVVVTDAESTVLPIEERAVRAMGGILAVGTCKTEDDVIALARDADGILYDYAPITARVIDALERCRVIVRYGVGLDRIDVAAAKQRGIEVRYLPGWASGEVAEHALALLLALSRQLLPLDRWVRGGGWGYEGERRTIRMAGKTLGLVGFGAIAQALAQKAAALEMKVLSFDPFVRPELFHKHRVRSVSLDEILEQSDVLSVHVPLTPETRNLIGPKEIGKMRPHAILINTARGGIVNESALLEALASGKLAGAGLDVFAQEPPSKDNPLFGLANVILTPHMACFSETSMDEMHTRAIQHVVDVLGGEDDRS